MSLKKIIELENKDYKKGKILKEKMDKFIPDVKPYFSCRNGMVYVLVGSGGSGKTQLLMSCLLYTSPSPRDGLLSRMPSSA